MVNYPNYLSGSQDDINKRLLQMILELQKGDSGENAKIAALEEAVGDKVSGLVKAVADITDEIGADNKSGTIKGRIKTLEEATWELGDC